MISHYSARDLTFASDRLPALAGITTKLSALLHDECLNGIWNKDLHRGLLLFHWANASSSAPTYEHAPSWSWAALDNQVNWDRNLWIDEVMYSWKIEVFGYQGKIRIRLVGLPMQFFAPNTGLWGYLALKDFAVEARPDGWFKKYAETEKLGEKMWIKDASGRETAVKAFKSNVVIMLIICLRSRIHIIEEPTPRVWCLILQAQSGIERGLYKRVGVTTLTLPNTKYAKADLEIVFGQLRELQKPLEDCRFEEIDEKGNYNIIVV